MNEPELAAVTVPLRTGSTNTGNRSDGGFTVSLALGDGYTFTVDPHAPGAAGFVIDEAPPLGAGLGPSPARVLASAMAACLGSSLLFCLRKAHVDPVALRVIAEGTYTRNEQKRLRIGEIRIRLEPDFGDTDPARARRCLEVFEDFCLVTESVRHGIPVDVQVTMPAVPPGA